MPGPLHAPAVDRASPRMRAMAWAGVLLFHALLLQLLRQEIVATDEHAGWALQVEWIQSHPPAAGVTQQRDAPRRTRAAHVAHDSLPAAPGVNTPADDTRASKPRLDLALPAPVRERLAAAPGREPALARAPSRLDGGRPERFRMQAPVTPERALQSASRLLGFWPPGYELDPCPRIRANIASRLAQTSPEARSMLEEEMRRERALCNI